MYIIYVSCSRGVLMWRVAGVFFYVSCSGDILMSRVAGVF